jgi:hypothetical protein
MFVQTIALSDESFHTIALVGSLEVLLCYDDQYGTSSLLPLYDGANIYDDT